jgi:hypothetical protein
LDDAFDPALAPLLAHLLGRLGLWCGRGRLLRPVENPGDAGLHRRDLGHHPGLALAGGIGRHDPRPGPGRIGLAGLVRHRVHDFGVHRLGLLHGHLGQPLQPLDLPQRQRPAWIGRFDWRGCGWGDVHGTYHEQIAWIIL